MAIVRHPYKNYSEFLAIRARLQGKGDPDVFRLGGSDVATVYRSGSKIGLNKWSSPTVFFYECCDFFVKPRLTNLPMLRGTIQEQTIYKEYWRYFNPQDPTNDAFLENWYGEKRVYRTAVKSHAIILNEKYPWLFISPDFIIRKNPYTKPGPLETKSTGKMEDDTYEAGIATRYVIQNHDQMLVLDAEYGELFSVQDATTPLLFQFEKNKDIEGNIIESSHDFVQRVLKGKKIVHSNMPALEKEQALAMLAPPDDGNPLYTDFLKERHRPENAKATVEGDHQQLALAVDYLKLKEQGKELDGQVMEKENKIREWFRDTSIGIVNFDGVGQVKWFEKLSVQKKILENVEV